MLDCNCGKKTYLVVTDPRHSNSRPSGSYLTLAQTGNKLKGVKPDKHNAKLGSRGDYLLLPFVTVLAVVHR